MPTITLKSGNLFYAKQGKEDQRPLLLIHGAGGSHLTWPTELRRLPATAVYAIDLPGHGRSDSPGCDTIGAYADVVEEFITTLDLRNVVVLGHSMGGAIAQTIALRHLPQVSGLILLGTGAKLPVSDAILDQVLTDFDAAVAFITKYSWSRSAPEQMIALGKQIMGETSPAIVHGDFVACNGFDVRDQLGNVAVPTLVVSGEVDKMTPVKFGRFLAEHIPDAQFELIDGAGHMLMLERPLPVTTHIQQFLVE